MVAIPLLLVLYVTLRRVDEGWALIALTPGLIGLISIILSRPILEMVAISDVYGRATAYAGIASNLVVFGLYVPLVGVHVSLFSVAGYVIWYSLMARRLFQLARSTEAS